MPTYDYTCQSCGHTQEEFHPISSTPDVRCQECGGACDKAFTVNDNFLLKGDGWPDKERRMKSHMTAKNRKSGAKMREREHYGEGVSSMDDLKKT